MESEEERIIKQFFEALRQFQKDWETLKRRKHLEKDEDFLKTFADHVGQLSEDAEKAQKIFETKADAAEISHLLTMPLWGNVTLLYAADTFNEIQSEDSLLFDLIEEFQKHPEQYQYLFGAFDNLIRKFNT